MVKKYGFFCGVYVSLLQASLLAACVFLSTCGLEEYYYLPQVPQTYISTELNTQATINIPPLTEAYALGYKIFYRIYIGGYPLSGIPINTSSDRSSISAALERDYNDIYPNTDPTNNIMGTPANTLFKNRNYFELALDGVDIDSLFSTSGGNVRITFPTSSGPDDNPFLTFNGVKFTLLRSNYLLSPIPTDKYFRNTDALNAPENAIANINADVASYSVSPRYSYVSMYIAAYGINPTEFTPIYSKPTHISIFMLPEG